MKKVKMFSSSAYTGFFIYCYCAATDELNSNIMCLWLNNTNKNSIMCSKYDNYNDFEDLSEFLSDYERCRCKECGNFVINKSEITTLWAIITLSGEAGVLRYLNSIGFENV